MSRQAYRKWPRENAKVKMEEGAQRQWRAVLTPEACNTLASPVRAGRAKKAKKFSTVGVAHVKGLGVLISEPPRLTPILRDSVPESGAPLTTSDGKEAGYVTRAARIWDPPRIIGKGTSRKKPKRLMRLCTGSAAPQRSSTSRKVEAPTESLQRSFTSSPSPSASKQFCALEQVYSGL